MKTLLLIFFILFIAGRCFAQNILIDENKINVKEVKKEVAFTTKSYSDILLSKSTNIELTESNIFSNTSENEFLSINKQEENNQPQIKGINDTLYNDLYKPDTKSIQAATYYSRITGNWSSNLTWSTVGCGGVAAASTPGVVAGDVAIICNTNTVSVTANPANALTSVTVQSGGYLKCGTTGGGANKSFAITAGGTFTVDNGGTYEHNTTQVASTRVFNGTESFGASSTIIISNWSATTTNLITSVSSNFGNLTLNYSTGAFIWQCNGLGSTNTINGTLTVGSLCAAYLSNSGALVNITIGGDLIVNGQLQVKRASASVNLTVIGNTTVTSATGYFFGIYGVSPWAGDFTFTTTNLTITNSARFWGNYNGDGNVTINVNGLMTINSANPQFVGIDNAFVGNYGTITCNINSFDYDGGVVIFHSTPITDGRTCTINITNNFDLNFTAAGDFVEFSNLIGAQNQIYNFNVGGNFIVSGNTSALFKTKQDGTGNDFVNITGNLSISGGTNGFSDANTNTLACTIGGNVTISAGTVNFSTVATSKIDLIIGTANVNWSQTGGTVSLCNTNIKTGKTLTMTGTKMGDIQASRTITVETGAKLYCSNYPVSGIGNFTLQTGTTLGIGSAAGIVSAGASGNIQVTGTRTFNSGASYEYYEGLVQVVGIFNTTPLASTVENLIINKSVITNYVVLNRNITINTALQLTAGCLDLKDFLVTFSNTANLTGGETEVKRILATDAGGFEGQGIGYITTTRVNPTGNVANLGLDFTPVVALGSTVFIRGHKEQTGTIPFGSNKSIYRYYDIQPTAKALSDITINSFNYFDAELGTQAPNEANLQMFQWAQVGASPWWMPRTTTGASTVTNYVASTTTTNLLTTYKITLGSVTAPLPVELISFKVECNDEQNNLMWQTASEQNNDFFILEKSFDGQNFSSFTQVPSQGNSNVSQSYSAIDYTPFNGINYYRLKQTDFDGQFTYSNIVSLNCSSSNNYEDILPVSPSTGNVDVLLKGIPGNKYQIKLTNVLGQVITNKKVTLPENQQTIRIFDANLANGIYYIIMQTEKKNISKSIILSNK